MAQHPGTVHILCTHPGLQESGVAVVREETAESGLSAVCLSVCHRHFLHKAI